VAGQTIRVVVRTTKGTAKEDVERAVEQALRGQYGELMGPLGPPVAAKVAEIMGHKAEDALGAGSAVGEYNQLTCFIEAEWDIKNADTREIILRDTARVLETAEREGHKIEFIYFNIPFNPESIAMQISASEAYVEYGPFDRIVIYHHGAQIIYAGREMPGLRGQSKYEPFKYYAVVPAYEILEVLAPFVKPGGYFWIWGCGQKYALWQAEADQYGYDLKIRVYPENQEHDYAKHIAPFVNLFTK